MKPKGKKGKGRGNWGPRKAGNGASHRKHAGNGVHDPSPTLQVPEGSTAAHVKMETHADDPRFANVKVEGTLPIETAMSLFALIHPRPH